MATEQRTISYKGHTQPNPTEKEIEALRQSLRASVERDKRVWTLKTRTKELGGKPYKWWNKKLTFGGMIESSAVDDDGTLHMVITVPMDIQ